MREILEKEKEVLTKMSDSKQVIIIRKDLKMRRGKEIAQGAHASMAFLEEVLLSEQQLTSEEKEWLAGPHAKIVCQVNSKEELWHIHDLASQKGLTSYLITDYGLTEFDGPQDTCVAIGPHYSHKFKEITDQLKLY